MKKAVHLLVIVMFICVAARAQYFTIPDTNFAAYLSQVAPNCIQNGNQLDIYCAGQEQINSMNCSYLNISSIRGIEYFTQLDTFMCNYTNIDSVYALPSSIVFLELVPEPPFGPKLRSLCPLPPNLQYLDVSYNLLKALPTLPSSLTYLNCYADSLLSLPTLPAGLQTLVVDYNFLSSLPALPTPLSDLECYGNLLTSLPTLPDSLWNLGCGQNQLVSLPALPAKLFTLDCSDNKLTSIPALPASLGELNCSFNQISTLPVFPTYNFQILNFGHNRVASLPALPATLISLNCSYNPLVTYPIMPLVLQSLAIDSVQIPAFPSFGNKLQSLSCQYVPIPGLVGLPDSIWHLDCGGPQLDTFYSLPGKLIYLDIYGSRVHSLPTLPPKLQNLTLEYDSLLSYIQAFPDSMWWLNLQVDNALHCLPSLNNISQLTIDISGLTCLPDFGKLTNPPLPLCTGSGCTLDWNVSGEVYFDAGGNCQYNSATDSLLHNIKLQLTQSGEPVLYALTTQQGVYEMKADSLESFKVQVDTAGLPFNVKCPSTGQQSGVVNAYNLTSSGNNFSLNCKNGFDLAVWSIYGYPFRGAFNTIVDLCAGDAANFYGASCITNTGGTITAVLSGPVSYAGPAIGAITPASVNGDTITWTVADFASAHFNTDFNFVVTVGTDAVIGQSICITATITPATGIDNNPANNTLTQCYPVISSFDPNVKEVYPAGDIDTSQQWLTYTIHFQNTGTDTAFNVYLLDTLDSHLDVNTFQLLAYSSPVTTQVLTGGILKFSFNHINLPDSGTSQTASTGYVQYKIKMKEGLTLGTQIQNTASIYFDANAPVQTNTTLNTISVTAGISTPQKFSGESISIYPNPSVGSWQLAVGNSLVGGTLEVFDEQGRVVMKDELRSTKYEITTGSLPSGVYYLRVSNDKVSVVRKLVKI